MGISDKFDKRKKIYVDLQKSVLHVADQSVQLGNSKSQIAFRFISLGGNKRASIGQMIEWTGFTEGSVKVFLSGLRKEARTITVAGDVTAESLFQTYQLNGPERLVENPSVKQPYSYNQALANLIAEHGLDFDPKLLRGVDTAVNHVIGCRRDPLRYQAFNNG